MYRPILFFAGHFYTKIRSDANSFMGHIAYNKIACFPNEDSDQAVRLCRLIWVFAGRTRSPIANVVHRLLLFRIISLRQWDTSILLSLSENYDFVFNPKDAKRTIYSDLYLLLPMQVCHIKFCLIFDKRSLFVFPEMIIFAYKAISRNVRDKLTHTFDNQTFKHKDMRAIIGDVSPCVLID